MTNNDMDIRSAQSDQASKIKDLGSNFDAWFGTSDISAAGTALFSTPLPKPLTGREIMQMFPITPVSIKDIYTLMPSLKKSALFIVDAQGTNRVVFVFKNPGDTNWTLVSRELEAEPWFGDVDIYSLTKI